MVLLQVSGTDMAGWAASHCGAANAQQSLADAAQTNAVTDAWAGYDIAVNALITAYWNSEAQSDANQTHAVNAAYVSWAADTDAAWADYQSDVADANAQLAVANAEAENAAWHLIHAVAKTNLVANAGTSGGQDRAATREAAILQAPAVRAATFAG